MSADTYELDSLHAAIGRVWAALGDLAPDELGKDIAEIVSSRVSRSHREAETRVAVAWRCEHCDCWSHERVAVQNLVDGKFSPGNYVRCVNCKDVSYLPLASPQRETEGRGITEETTRHKTIWAEVEKGEETDNEGRMEWICYAEGDPGTEAMRQFQLAASAFPEGTRLEVWEPIPVAKDRAALQPLQEKTPKS